MRNCLRSYACSYPWKILLGINLDPAINQKYKTAKKKHHRHATTPPHTHTHTHSSFGLKAQKLEQNLLIWSTLL